jgi:putative membrane protein
MGVGMGISRSLVTVAAATLLSACAGGGGSERVYAPASSSQARRAAPRPPRPTAQSSAAYVANAGAIDLFVIRASELAMGKSQSQRVRDVATRLISAHKGTSGQLSLEGRRLNALPSATLPPRFQSRIDALSAAADFDSAFVAAMRQVHQEALASDARYAAAHLSPTLTPVAKARRPVMEQCLRLLSYL